MLEPAVFVWWGIFVGRIGILLLLSAIFGKRPVALRLLYSRDLYVLSSQPFRFPFRIPVSVLGASLSPIPVLRRPDRLAASICAMAPWRSGVVGATASQFRPVADVSGPNLSRRSDGGGRPPIRQAESGGGCSSGHPAPPLHTLDDGVSHRPASDPAELERACADGAFQRRKLYPANATRPN